MAAINKAKVMENLAVLPFYGAGALFFLGLSILMFIAADSFQGHFFQPHTLALVHTAALGWGTMIIFGAAYQLIPVIFEKPLFSNWLAFLSFCLLFVGAILLISSFWFFSTGWPMLSGGTFIVLSALLYIFNLFATADYKALSISKIFVFSSALWLLGTVVAGLLLAINLSHPFIQNNHLELLKIHAHLGFAGWFLQLISGVSSILVPMFLFGKSSKSMLLKTAFVLQNAGLAGFVVDHFFSGPSGRTAIYIGLVLLGVLFWLAFLIDVYRNRVRKKVDVQMYFTGSSLIGLLLAFACLPLILFYPSNPWNNLYGVFVFLGWISAIIFGKTFKTLPFILWNHHYKEVHGQKNIPLPKDLYSQRLIHYQFWIFVAAGLTLSGGILLNLLLLIKMALILWILVAALYVTNVAKIFLHKKRI